MKNKEVKMAVILVKIPTFFDIDTYSALGNAYRRAANRAQNHNRSTKIKNVMKKVIFTAVYFDAEMFLKSNTFGFLKYLIIILFMKEIKYNVFIYKY